MSECIMFENNIDIKFSFKFFDGLFLCPVFFSHVLTLSHWQFKINEIERLESSLLSVLFGFSNRTFSYRFFLTNKEKTQETSKSKKRSKLPSQRPLESMLSPVYIQSMVVTRKSRCCRRHEAIKVESSTITAAAGSPRRGSDNGPGGKRQRARGPENCLGDR